MEEHISRQDYKEMIGQNTSIKFLESVIEIVNNSYRSHEEIIKRGSMFEDAHRKDMEWCVMAKEVITERIEELTK